MPRTQLALLRLTTDLQTREVSLDGVRIALVDHATTLLLFERIAQGGGRVVSHKELRRIPGCRCGKRFDRLLNNHLPAVLRQFIVSTRGRNGGYAIKLPPREEVHYSPQMSH
ncbi:MAG: hypothetical protein JNM56_15170 [Planctomycetia bacterium]|nr:hypothetical protein [Planctomycetia bacterium]